jgi:hypothetical protein
LGQQGTLARQRNDLKDVKLEIMFVIESSDFMFNKYDDGPALLTIAPIADCARYDRLRTHPAEVARHAGGVPA